VRRRLPGSLLLAASALLAAAPAGAAAVSRRELAVAAASDLKFAMEDLIAEFRRLQPDVAVTASYGSSGNFYAQLTHRAPFDLFFSADREYVDRLAAQGSTLRDSVFLYAVGHVVVWTPKSSPFDVERLGIAALAHPRVRRVAIANPRHAPYGRAAEAALRALGVYDAVQPRLVLGENVAQAAQFVQTGAAEAGVIALSLALAPSMREAGRFWRVPPDAYPRMEQTGVILEWARDPEAARAFRSFVLGEAGRSVLERHGFGPPEE
jgi:molybdate transport system substrate-binding protein